jgi:hypothetical protein
MARYSCVACGHSQAAKDELIGKRAKCPKCSVVNPIMAAPKPAPLPSPKVEGIFTDISEDIAAFGIQGEPDDPTAQSSASPESFSFKDEDSGLPIAASISPSVSGIAQASSITSPVEDQEIHGEAGARGFLVLLGSTAVLFFSQIAAFATLVIYPFMGTRKEEMAKVGQVTGLVLSGILLVCALVSVFGLIKLRRLASGKAWKNAVLRTTAACIATPCFVLGGAIGPLMLGKYSPIRLQFAAISNLLAFAALIVYLICLISLMKQCGEFLQNQRVVALSEKVEPALRWWLLALVGMVCLLFTSAFIPNPPAVLGLASLAALGLFIVSEVYFAARFLIAMGAATRACSATKRR